MNKDNTALNVFLFMFGIVIFLGMAFLLIRNSVSGYDDFIYSIVSSFKCEPVTLFCMFLSLCCSTYFLIISMIVILIISNDKKKAFYICLNLLLCCLINQGLKLLFGRIRPVDINLIVEKGFSFPSGHSMASMAYYGLFVYLINIREDINKNLKIVTSTLLILLIILIGISRIYLGVHFASDVTAGFALGLAYLVIYINYVYKKRITKN